MRYQMIRYWKVEVNLRTANMPITTTEIQVYSNKIIVFFKPFNSRERLKGYKNAKGSEDRLISDQV